MERLTRLIRFFSVFFERVEFIFETLFHPDFFLSKRVLRYAQTLFL